MALSHSRSGHFPRALDHAVDLAHVAAAGKVEVLILDFRNAFMSIPISPKEAQYNCCLLEQPLTRRHGPLDAHEPRRGGFVVWRVLGFGGKPYPLLYARVA